MIPTEDFYDDMLVKLEDLSPSNPQIEKYNKILGVSSIWLLPSLGSLLLFTCVYPAILLTFLVLYILNRYLKLFKKPMETLSSVLFWNWPIN